MGEVVKIVAILAAKAGHETELESLLRSMVEASRSEAGNVRYDLWQDAEDPGRFVLDELYVDSHAMAFHRATPHFQGYLSRINDVAVRTVVTVRPVDVKGLPAP